MNVKQAKTRVLFHISVWPVAIAATWFDPRIGLCAIIGLLGWNATRNSMVRLQLLEHDKGEWLESGTHCKCSHRRWQHQEGGECIHPQCSCTAFIPGEVE